MVVSQFERPVGHQDFGSKKGTVRLSFRESSRGKVPGAARAVSAFCGDMVEDDYDGAKQSTPRAEHLTGLFPLDDLDLSRHIYIYTPDLHDLYDLYYLAHHVAGGEPYNLHDPQVGHIWLCWSCTRQILRGRS